ncbi:uncharacterized protein MELLADRAFT_38569 [Melampsora larici-populina 98AG31]|uniref:Ubiquitin-activating enzyme E1-like n=1 Tax=Melampsora larici-populina (strain 98AG31 / pathotype 3-4-7) TaxID=747676 RepID=F4RYP9_MELLP|nr:uncharacterized protein MELLADRAFT_38569 [Melampsora larici-populina 98AG31]EGG02539.1 hypothetical protein MELLADRAFT_38569 [Melampsora larici-populina 98AG31]
MTDTVTSKSIPTNQSDIKKERNSNLIKIFGPSVIHQIKSTKILVIGAGGIGCELLKNLVCSSFEDITIIDLDTIDTSNLNRQFLFQKRHVKRPKAIVAKETAINFNPSVKIKAIQANILNPEYSTISFYKSFDLVLNALDNLTARRHVNKFCVASNVPLIESGTAGYAGQVQPIANRQMECYDCQPKPTPKTFPVCTIRSTPSTPIHCIVWAKNYLFGQLFGADDENDGNELDEALKNGESVKELENLRIESQEMKEIKKIGFSKPESLKKIFEKVYTQDIQRLLKMWTRTDDQNKPSPLDFDVLVNQSKHLVVQIDQTSKSTNGLKDQQVLDLLDSFKLFGSSLMKLDERMESSSDNEPLTWDKDDDDALDFVTAAANLRAHVFGIPLKTRFEVKEMAGNIIPAIATTNSAISALIIFQAIQILTKNSNLIKSSRPWYTKTSDRLILSGSIDEPNPKCEVCSYIYVRVKVLKTCTLKSFLEEVFEDIQDGIPIENLTIQEGDRLILDPDFLDNLDLDLLQLGLFNPTNQSDSKFLVVTDEDEEFVPISFILER